jgi:hypothetical protein
MFTIAIPTRNRSNTLRHCLRTCLSQDYKDLQVIVSDNCSTDDTADVVKSLAGTRLRYLRTPHPMSMAAHFEWLLSRCLEANPNGYIAMLGDDDGYIPGAFTLAAKILEEHDWPKALRWDTSDYVWPNSPVEELRNRGQISCSNQSILLHGSSALAEVCAHRMSYVHLPGVYGGIVHASVFRDVEERCGKKVFSHLPDVSLAVNAACVVDRYVYSKIPISIYGTHLKSNGLSQVTRLTDVHKTFAAENDIPVHPDIALSCCWAFFNTESILQAQSRGLLPNGVKPDLELSVRVMVLESEKQRDDIRAETLQAARETAEKHGIDFNVERIRQHNTDAKMRDWLHKDPICPMDESHVTMDFGKVGIDDIFDACFAGATLFWSVLTGPVSLPTRLQRFHANFEESRAESNRRAVERDRAKESLRKAQAKIEKLQAKLAEKEKAQSGWLRKWLPH